MEESIFSLINRGGFLIYPIIACSIIAVGIIAERIITLQKSLAGRKGFVEALSDIVTSGFNPTSALNLCDKSPGILPRLAKTAIVNRDIPKEDLKEIIETEASRIVPALHKNLNLLSVIGQISPLLGLLGTVIGMINAFAAIQQASMSSGVVGTEVVAGGIWTALISTAAGLSVAIPVYISHNFLERWADTIVNELEISTSEVVRMVRGA